jgi:serine/threonine protein kinase
MGVQAEVHASLRFPHIINLLAICLEPQKLSLIMEFAPFGSLYSMLHEPSRSPVDAGEW